MPQEIWNKLVKMACMLGIEPSLYDRREMLGDPVCFHLINAGNYKGAWVYWMKKT